MTISFKLNNKPVSVETDGERLLLWALRGDLGLTGTKFGCGEGHCGACTVLLDGVPVRSCITKIKEAANKEIVTIEGLAKDGKLHPLQKAFVKHDALQCGFCTPGMILTAHGLLATNPKPSREQIVHAMNENFCRCGAHTRIIDAIQTAATEISK